MRRWRLADADWNHWSDGLADTALWPALAGLGLAGVEIGVYTAAEQLAPVRVARWPELTARYGIGVVAVLLSLPAPRWPDGALGGCAIGVAEQVRHCARICRRLGLSTLGLWPGADPPGTAWPALVAGLGQARDAATAEGVRLAVEYKPGTAVPDAATALALADAVEGTGVLLDLGHAYAAGEDPVEVTHRLGARLWHVHLGDAAPGRPDDDLPLGRVHDARPVLAALDAIGFTGVAAFDLYGATGTGELRGRDAVAQSLAHLGGPR